MSRDVFKKAIVLDERVAVYVPSTVSVDKKVDTSEYVDEAIKLLSELFGGATAVNALGGWVSDTAGLVKEGVTMVYSNTAGLQDEHLDKIGAFAERLKSELQQEAVSVEINGCLYIV